MNNVTVYFDSYDIIEGLKREIEYLKTDNEYMLCILREIEQAIDHGDQQKISFAIRQLRGQLGTEKLKNREIKLGLEKE